MTRALLPTAAAILALVLLNGCPAEKKKSEPVATCASAGPTCVYAPGKLGVCVESVDGNPRFICQSQH